MAEQGAEHLLISADDDSDNELSVEETLKILKIKTFIEICGQKFIAFGASALCRSKVIIFFPVTVYVQIGAHVSSIHLKFQFHVRVLRNQ